jgi:RNA polymerase sigma-70 factor, ECF subfamily
MNSIIDMQNTRALIRIVTTFARSHRIPCDHEDFIQDLLINLLQRRAKRLLPQLVPPGWLKRFVDHRAVDLHRHYKRRPQKFISDLNLEDYLPCSTDAAPVVTEIQSPDSDPDLKPLLDAALQHLSDEHKRTIMLLAEGYTYEDIASITGTKVGTVRSRIHYARKRLAPLMVAEAS